MSAKYPEIISSIDQIGTGLEKRLSELMNLARLGNKYLADEEPWKQIKTDPERVKNDHVCCASDRSRTIGSYVSRFLPFTSKKLKGILNRRTHLPEPEMEVQ